MSTRDSIDTSTPQAKHRDIAEQAKTEQRSQPGQVLKDSQAAALKGTSNGPSK